MSEESKPDLLLWLDLETTGSEVEHDCIIEIGCVLTTTNLTEIAEWSSVVTPSPLGLGRLMQNAYVRNMHETNGLLGEILADDATEIRPHDAAKSLMAWLAANNAGQGRTVLAGSGVGHFDRRFIARYLPQLDKHLRYWCIDIGVVRRAHEMWSGAPQPSSANDAKTHRALDDARCHLAEARAFALLWESP